MTDELERLAKSLSEAHVEIMAKAMWSEMLRNGQANDLRGWEPHSEDDGTWRSYTPAIDDATKDRIRSAARASYAALRQHLKDTDSHE